MNSASKYALSKVPEVALIFWVIKIFATTLIDKGSVVIAILLAWWLLKEAITLRLIIGALLIVAGLFVIAKK
ncbi:MAG: hypothetical protein Q7T42_02395 [Methylotenera sp.]|uniref:hypothetical protein n=1 Tax=Methylotenera sp. TaxID=2051956 RepID=UPI00271C3422|nr:hypothetical protein [Methylotenera sp.]MDO9204006.1 hypothetical protein [Methylotenera sp.]MDO9392812.1 hypothetical protein [Methylotenera sp.]MDP3308879.1 hypothetical protein [Methylotenera sp.]MDP3818526.1 hypothetical protein [Methylotenera sp.]MDZ4211284.1 hypothetical protein [Methylotenera sp.]